MRAINKSLAAARSAVSGFFRVVYTKPEAFFLFHTAIFGLFVVFLVPPFQAPDETSHLERAYQISQGNLIEDPLPDGGIGGTIPNNLWTAGLSTIYLVGDQNMKFTSKEFEKIKNIPLEPSLTYAADFRTSSSYAPVVYAPQALALFFGRVLEVRPLLLLWLARLTGLAVFLAAGYFSIRILPNRKWLFTLLLCLPMSLFIAASVGADVVIKSSAILVVALVLALRADNSLFGKRWYLAGLLVAAVVLAVSKQVYLPLALLPAILLFEPAVRAQRRQLWYVVGLLATVFVAWVAWALFVQSLHLPTFHPAGLTAGQGVGNALSNVPQYGAVNLSTIFTYNSNGYVGSFIGIFGYLDTPLPNWMVIAFYGILFLYMLQREKISAALRPGQRRLVVLLSAGAFLLVLAALYVLWTRPASSFVDGLQGRYFWPIVVVAVTALPAGFITFRTHSFKAVYSGLLLCSMLVISYRYYVLPSPFIRTEVQHNKFMEKVKVKYNED